MKLDRNEAWACAVFVLCTMTTVALPAQTFTSLYSFDGTDGAKPTAALVKANNGYFYGTTLGGGTSCVNSDPSGCGTVFDITPGGALTTLHSFCAQSGCPDGQNPSAAALVQGTDGNLYGTTYYGGANGEGTVFKITPSGALTTLYNFCSQGGINCTDGENPTAGLVQATDGNFYGTTGAGGAYAGGIVFKITPSGTLTTLYSFCSQSSCADGTTPVAGLVQANSGDFYGTTVGGGVNSSCLHSLAPSGCGTVFKITPNGALTTLYSFCSQGGTNCTAGENPQAALVQATDGNFYGTTYTGGANSYPYSNPGGTVFKITANGTLTTLYSFCSQGGYGCTDGKNPVAALLQGTDGNLYGTTYNGGAYAGGTLFKITPRGTLTTLYNFCPQSGCTDGWGPTAGLVQVNNGNFYGTTQNGGANNDGTVFSLSMATPPSVPAVNAGGVLNSGSYTTQGVAQGSVVSIFGTNLAASTAVASAIPLPTALSDVVSVTFNGVPAGLYFVSQNQINAQLPFDVLPGQSNGTASIVVTRSSGTSAPQNVTVIPTSPGILTTTSDGLGQAFAYDNTTGSLAAPAGAPIGPFTTAPISVSSGDALIIACTGLGSVNPSIGNYLAASDGVLRYTILTPTVLIGGVAATPIYSVLSPQFVSEYQIGVTPAADTPPGNAVPIQIQIGGVTTTNQVTIAVAP